MIEQMEKGETADPRPARHLRRERRLAATGALVEDGARVSQVNDGSAAEDAGLRDGDVITKVDDTLITGADSLVATDPVLPARRRGHRDLHPRRRRARRSP